MTKKIELIANNLHILLKINSKYFNLSNEDFSQVFNRFIILIYYADKILMSSTSLDLHYNLNYYCIDGSFSTTSKLQAENTPASSVSICSPRNLN